MSDPVHHWRDALALPLREYLHALEKVADEARATVVGCDREGRGQVVHMRHLAGAVVELDQARRGVN